MKSLKWLAMTLCVGFVFACLQLSAFAQSEEKTIANLSTGTSGARWDVGVPHAGMTLTVSGPDGQVFRKEFKAGAPATFSLSDTKGERLPDGVYTYELRLTPVLAEEVKESLAEARAKGDDAAVERSLRKRGILPSQSMVQSGSFSIMNGSLILPGAFQENQSIGKTPKPQRVPLVDSGAAVSRLRMHHARLNPMPDFVIADDLIVQGSACVGIDCVNGEVFGFDTIRVKENNTRIQFDDTSTTAGFPTNNWQIRANSSASGGASFLAFVDQGATGNSETGTIVFEVDAGAPANSIKVASTGRVGLRTATPVLDLHANTSNTPAFRLEQNSSGGFTAQTWDIAGNEANFFIRDVTSGSRLPFRIRPGAPTSSIDIAATGNVGINTASPSTTLDVSGNIVLVGSESGTTNRGNNTIKLSRFSMPPFTSSNLNVTVLAGATTSTENIVAFGGEVGGQAAATRISFVTAGTTNTDTGTIRMTINSSGQVGIGTSTPSQTLSVNGTAGKTGGGSWDVFSDERLKNIKGKFDLGLNAVMQLQPMRYEYKPKNALDLNSSGEHVGFTAQAVQDVIPEAVKTSTNGYLTVNNDPILWAMLNAIKEQQKEIEQLKAEIKELRSAVEQPK